MNQALRLPGLVVLVLLFAGCAGSSSNSSHGLVAPAAVPGEAPAHTPEAEAVATGPLQEIDASGKFTSDGVMPPEALACFDPSNAFSPPSGTCEAYFTMFLNMSGALTGRITNIFHFHRLPDGSLQAKGTRIFTGSVSGCGSGTLSLRLDGVVTSEPNTDKPGYLRMKEAPQTLLNGSTTTGLAGVVDARVVFSYNATFGPTGAASIRDGSVAGTIWCRLVGDATSLSSHHGTKALSIAGRFTMDGGQTESQVSCDPATRQCELYPDLFLDFFGPMEGRVVDHGHFHHHGSADTQVDGYGERIFTGSIRGCGSGTLTLLLGGTIPADPHAPPGLVHMREPRMHLVPGSTTTGFAGLTDADLVLEWNMTAQGTIRDGTVTGMVWCRNAPDRPPVRDHAGARALTVTMRTVTDGILLPKEGNCAADPARPEECDAYATQYLLADKPWNAMILDAAQVHSYANGTVWAKAERPFFGEVPGCGSGMMTFRASGILGPVSPVLDKPGYFTFKEPTMKLVPGSTSTGLRHLVDAEMTGDFVFTGAGAGVDTFTGTVWCR